MAEPVGYLTNDHGVPSSMRLTMLLCVLTSIAFGFITLLHSGAAATGNGLYLCGLFLAAGIGGKSVQTFTEHLKPPTA